MQSQFYLRDVIKRFEELKRLADKAIEQARPEHFRKSIDAESNTILILMKHLAGNMKSRWHNFLTSDGEKQDRDRDREFEDIAGDSIDVIRISWEEGWQCLFKTISGLKPEDLDKTILIRNEPHRVFQAINRQLIHYGYHVGQIVFLAKHFAFEHWKSLSIPRGGSAKFNESQFDKKAE